MPGSRRPNLLAMRLQPPVPSKAVSAWMLPACTTGSAVVTGAFLLLEPKAAENLISSQISLSLSWYSDDNRQRKTLYPNSAISVGFLNEVLCFQLWVLRVCRDFPHFVRSFSLNFVSLKPNPGPLLSLAITK